METTLASANEKQIWLNKFFKEYVRRSRFAKYMGKADTSIIVAKYELQEEAGKKINIPLITSLKGNGVGGSGVLDGREEALGNYNCGLEVEWIRNGVRVPKSTQYKTEINLLNAAKPMLRQWSGETLRTDLIYAMMSVVTGADDTVPYAEMVRDAVNGGWEVVSGYTPGSAWERYQDVTWTSATEANKDAWLAANSDRILFGSRRDNNQSNDHSASLATLDTTNDKMTSAVGSLAKRMAENASPAITPFQTDDGAEFYVQFTGPRAFRDLKLDSAIIAANREARAREGSGMDRNPLFQDGDLLYDGILYVKIPEIPHLTGVGADSADVEPSFLCGQQALGVAWGQEPAPKTDYAKDYGFRPGVAIEELRQAKKLAFNGHQHGMVTIYTAAAPDA